MFDLPIDLLVRARTYKCACMHACMHATRTDVIRKIPTVLRWDGAVCHCRRPGLPAAYLMGCDWGAGGTTEK